MSRRFTIVTLALAAVVAFLVGVIVAGGWHQSSVTAGPAKRVEPVAAARPVSAPSAGLVNFADVVEKINPAVVNIDATAAGTNENRRRRPGFPRMASIGPTDREEMAHAEAPAADSSSIRMAVS